LFFPIGDTPNPRHFRPYANYAIILANILVYVLISFPLSLKQADIHDQAFLSYLRVVLREVPDADPLEIAQQTSQYDLFVFEHGYKPGAPALDDLFFSLFLHGNLAHLLGNMLFLWIFGDNVEHRLGRLGYLVNYLVMGVIATLFFSLFASKSLTPMVGASGAISGVMGVYFVSFPRNRVKLFVFLFPFLFDVFLIPARFVIGMFILFDNLLPFILGARTGVAYGAHLGGFLGGLVLAHLGQKTAWVMPWKGKRFAVMKGDVKEPDADVLALREAISMRDKARALQALSNIQNLNIALLEADEVVTLAMWLFEEGYQSEAIVLLRKAMGVHRSGRELAKIMLAMGTIRLYQGQHASAFQYLTSVFDLNPDEETKALARDALSRLHIDPRTLRPY
jgi:membrane associated rhomboid family serine protease